MDNKPTAKAMTRRPTADQLRRELERLDQLDRKRGLPTALRVVLFLVVVILIAAVTFFCLLSGYVIYGNSMYPTLLEQDLVLAIPNAEIHSGDLVAFRHEERILIKRAIAGPHDSIEVLDNGHVRLNGKDLIEPYAFFSDSGVNDLDYPIDIPAGSWFVLGDNRGNSVDSRSSIIGLIDDDQILGKVFIRIWPLPRFEVFDSDFFPQLIQAFRPA